MGANRTVNFSPEVQGAVAGALCLILEGKCKRVDVAEDVKVYECQNVLRIDLKIKNDG